MSLYFKHARHVVVSLAVAGACNGGPMRERPVLLHIMDLAGTPWASVPA